MANNGQFGYLEEIFGSEVSEAATGVVGERKFWLAMIEQACWDFVEYRFDRTKKGRRLYDDARDWFEHDSEGTLAMACSTFSLNPEAVLPALERLDRWSLRRVG